MCKVGVEANFFFMMNIFSIIYEKTKQMEEADSNTIEKEMYVWKQILANRGKWTAAELKESLRYINEIRTEEYGLTPLKIK